MAKGKNSAAVALSRLGAKKGGHARAAKLTPAQRSESARKAVQARWAKAKKGGSHKAARSPTVNKAVPSTVADTSDDALLAILKRIKATNSPREIRRLSDQLERVIFHKQFENARR